MDINTSPQQTLGRLISSFSANAYEIAEATLDNYLKYKFFEMGEINTEFSTKDIKIGQVMADFAFGENIFTKIWDKYDSQDKNIAGYSLKIENIKNLQIEINSKPFVVKNNSNEYVLGHNMVYGDVINHDNQITILSNKGKYVFDSLLTFTKNSFISFLGYDENYPIESINTVNATINFTYEYIKKPFVAKKIKSQSVAGGIGQYYEATTVNNSIYNEIYNKYYRQWYLQFCKLSGLYSVDIEANPRTVLLIRDFNDEKMIEYIHEIGDTGVLNLHNLTNIKEIRFLGIRQPDGSIKTKELLYTITKENGEKENVYRDISTDILVNYYYVLTKGEYLIES